MANPVPSAIPLAAVGLVGCTILLLEILLTRIFSVTLWYHFAFFAISLALFGLAASGVAVTLRPQARATAPARMAAAAAALAVAIPVCFRIDLALGFVPFDAAEAVLPTYGAFALKFLVLAVPFFLAGWILAVAFSCFPERVHGIYCADLVGGGVGSLLVVPVLLVLSGPAAVVATSTLPLLAAAMLYRSAGRRRLAAACALGIYLVLGLVVASERLGWLRIARIKSYDPRRAQVEEPPKLYERWHPVSRVAVHDVEHSGTPWSWFYAEGRALDVPPVMEVTNDGGARTFLYPRGSGEQLRRLFQGDDSDLVYALTTSPRVLVVGVGGGKDVLSALAFGASSVTGVELNPLMVEVVQEAFAGFTGAPFGDPRVRIAVDEGRNYVASRQDAYDVVKISVTDTWAASAVGAYAMTESYLYTTEATEDFLDHLRPGGFLSVTRWFPYETLRMTTLASDTLRRRGVGRPERRILMARNGATLTMLVKNGEVTEEERRRFAARAVAAGLTVVADGTGLPAANPEHPLDTVHRRAAAEPLAAIARDVALDVSPPTDDRPFFFNWSRLGEARRGRYLETSSGFTLQHGRALSLLWALLQVTAGAAALFVVAPLVLARSVRLGAVPARTRLAFNLYFLALGLGYLLVEIPLVQQLILFLGHPTYSLTVVLATMLVSSGLGSLLAERLAIDERSARFVFPAILVLLAAWTLVVPDVLHAAVGLPRAARIAMAVALVAPIGLVMGVPFPVGLRAAHRVDARLVPWAWAVNGAASVTAPVLAMMLAILHGFSTAFLAGLAAYAAAAGLLWILASAVPAHPGSRSTAMARHRP